MLFSDNQNNKNLSNLPQSPGNGISETLNLKISSGLWPSLSAPQSKRVSYGTITLTPDSSPVAFKYKSGRAARSGRVEAHGKGERRKFSDWQITVIFLAKKCFSCKLIFYASSLDFLTLVYINRSFYDVVSAKCVFLSSISALNWSSLEYFKIYGGL